MVGSRFTKTTALGDEEMITHAMHHRNPNCCGLWLATVSPGYASGVSHLTCAQCDARLPGMQIFIEAAQTENSLAFLFDDLVFEGNQLLYNHEWNEDYDG
jgi:hypothetical protein